LEHIKNGDRKHREPNGEKPKEIFMKKGKEKLFKAVYVNDGKALYKNGVKIASLKKSVDVDTTEYEFSHGKKPRGYGRWAFLMACNKQDIIFITGKKTRLINVTTTKVMMSSYYDMSNGYLDLEKIDIEEPDDDDDDEDGEIAA